MRLVLSIGAAALSAACFAQYSSNFEPSAYTGSAGGTNSNGQAGWYTPAVSGSLDGAIYTYSGNTLGFSSNPTGGTQFIAGISDGTNFVRAQHDVTFGTGLYTMSFDFNGKFNGVAPTADNLGSVSLQPSASANYFQTIYQWDTNTANPVQFFARFGHFNSSGSGGGLIYDSPGAAWDNVPVNHWFHQTITWDFATNLIVSTTIQDLTAGGAINTATPTGWYLAGGAGNTLGLGAPTAVRFFVGGSGAIAGNTMGFDNLSITPVPEPASMAALGVGVLALLRKRRRA